MQNTSTGPGGFTFQRDKAGLDNPSFMLGAIFERKREITQINQGMSSDVNVDPFFLLKEAAELSNLRSGGHT